MAAYDMIERMTLVALLQQEALRPDASPTEARRVAPHLVAQDAQRLILIAKREQKRVQYECDVGELPEDAQRRFKRDLATASAIAAHYGATVRMGGGDPRGFVLKLLLASRRHNSLGGADAGWGVPT